MAQSPRLLFVVQGEGRGHLTQAMVLHDLLKQAGAPPVAVLVGESHRRRLPAYVRQAFSCPLHTFRSPNFSSSPSARSVNSLSTFLRSLLAGGKYFRSLKTLEGHISGYQADVVVNFYEILCGLLYWFQGPEAEHICLGHQYLFHHPGFHRPSGKPAEARLFDLYTQATAFGAQKRLALSPLPLPDQGQLKVVPPLIHPPQPSTPAPSDSPFLLAYMNQNGYAEELIEWARHNPEHQVHAFWDHPQAPQLYRPFPHLHFHQLSGAGFKQMLQNCRGYACTAGFESVCEALSLGKPTQVVPVAGHYEQWCNAHDYAQNGLAVRSEHFALAPLVEALAQNQLAQHQALLDWFEKKEKAAEHVLGRSFPISATPEY